MDEHKYVSRGGLKLEAAISQFKIDVKDLIVLDVGSSTGGFVDCLLQHGAAKVYSVDTSYGELAWKLRNDPRVAVMERSNILHLQILSEAVDLVTIDASWTRLELILPVIRNFLKPDGQIVALLKPHYQANKKELVKGVLSKVSAEQVKNEVIQSLNELRFTIHAVIESPILGRAGNTEYLLQITPS